MDGKKFLPVIKDGRPQIFSGVTDKTTEVLAELSGGGVTGRYLRVHPTQCAGSCGGNFEIVGGSVER